MSNPKFLKDNLVCVDCDDTLILHRIETLNPDESKGEKIVIVDPNNKTGHGPRKVIVNQRMVDKLIDHYCKRDSVLVWSLSGAKWAKEVVKALQLETYVDVICAKPIAIYDDNSPRSWLPRYIYHLLPKGWGRRFNGGAGVVFRCGGFPSDRFEW